MNNQIQPLHRTAVSALNRGDYALLHKTCVSILSLDDTHADAWFFMSIVASAQKQIGKAIEFVERALTHSPNHSEYLVQKAKYHSLLKQDETALTTAELALKQNPTDAISIDTLGVVYTNLGKFNTARDLLEKSVTLKPNNPQFQFNLATAEQFVGNADKAKKHYEKAIELHPGFARAYWSLSELEKDKHNGERTERLESLFNSNKLSPEDELYIAHALSREYENNKQYDDAFETLKRGKHRRAAQLHYEIDQDKAIFESLKTEFSPTTNRSTPHPELGKGVIFIVGMPRSGTTLAERILSSHSDIISLGELQNFGVAVRRAVDSNSTKTLDGDIIRKALNADPEKIGEAYLSSIGSRRPKSGWFIDKMPLNFLYIGLIRRCLPGAKIICLRRNPMDTCLSNYRQLFAINFSYYNYHYSLENTAKYFSFFHDLMSHWTTCFADDIFELNYEALTHSPEDNISNLLKHIGVEWQQACLEFHKNKSAVATPSAMQVREKLYTKAVGRWHKFEKHLAPAISILDQAGIEFRN